MHHLGQPKFVQERMRAFALGAEHPAASAPCTPSGGGRWLVRGGGIVLEDKWLGGGVLESGLESG